MDTSDYDEYLGRLVAKLERQPIAALETVDADRDPGRPPTSDEDPLNAIVRWCSVRARQPWNRLLSGRKVVVKDVMPVAHVPMTGGSRALHGFVPHDDCTVVARLLRAGAEIAAVSNMDELGASVAGDTSCYGATLNPHDRTRSAGGSSGGSAAALSYPGIEIALGCDQGGSVRVPAAWCGVLGLKPTHGLVPYAGALSLECSLDHVGVIARSARDLAVTLQAIRADHHPEPPTWAPVGEYLAAVQRPAHNLDGWRLGFVVESLDDEVEPDEGVAGATFGALERLEGVGAEVARINVAEHTIGDVQAVLLLTGMSRLAQGAPTRSGPDGHSDALARALRSGLRAQAPALSPDLVEVLEAGRRLRRQFPASVYETAQRVARAARAGVDRALAEHDFHVLPTTPVPPFGPDKNPPPHGTFARRGRPLANTALFNVTGHPALTLPLAQADGLPVGLMFVARYGHEARLLAFAASCEEILGWTPQLGSRSAGGPNRRAGEPTSASARPRSRARSRGSAVDLGHETTPLGEPTVPIAT